jgi:hypothetical protein
MTQNHSFDIRKKLLSVQGFFASDTARAKSSITKTMSRVSSSSASSVSYRCNF